VQGGGSIAASLIAAYLMRRAGPGRTVGLCLGCFAVGSVLYLAGSLPLVLAGAALDGVGVVLLSVALFTAMQQYTPPRLQGRVSGAAGTLLITPQTLSIAAGAALIGVVSYRLLLLVMAVFIGACAAWLLVHPAPAPDAGPAGATDSPPAAAPPPDRDKDKDDLPRTDMFVPRQAPGKHADLARYDGSSGHGSA